MPSHICLIDGHPDPEPHFIHALCDAYEAGAHAGGHKLERIPVGRIDVPVLDSVAAFAEDPPLHIMRERDKIARADHLVIAFPLWLGGMPAKLKAFFEQAARNGFFLRESEDNKGWPEKMMAGKSARVILTMGMPGLIYRFAMDAGALKALERAVLGLSGFKPVRHTVLGGVESVGDDRRQAWLEEVRRLGEAGD
jgi:putative NADPH-quinone reductase